MSLGPPSGMTTDDYGRMIATIQKTERDPTGLQANQPGAKLDAGKVPVWQGLLLQFPRACAEVARVSEVGARKYSWGGWQSVSDGLVRYRNALGRHLVAIGRGELMDSDTGMFHAAQVAWNALAALELELRKIDEQHSTGPSGN